MKRYKNIKNKIPTCIIYTRVSSKEQVEGFSLESQEKICKAFADKSQLQVLKIFREEGESAKTANRTELRKMIDCCRVKQGKIGKLIVYKVDRLSRNTGVYYTLKAVFLRYGVTIQSATENITDDPVGKLMEAIFSGMAEFDNNVRAERTTGGMKTRLENGYWAWGAPLGYMNIKDKAGVKKSIIPHPEKSELIRKLFEEYATGKYSIRELTKKIKSLKTKHNKYIYPQRVREILRNHIYYGRIEMPEWGVSTKGNHEPLISEALFQKAQDVLTGKSKKMPRNRDHPDFPLRGVRCECGGSISGGRTKGRHKYYQYYGCFKKECSKRKVLDKIQFEKEFTEFLSELTPNEDEFDALEKAIVFAFNQEAENLIKNDKQIEKRIVELKMYQERLLNLKVKDLLTDDEFFTEKEKIKSQITNLELEQTNPEFQDINITNAVEFAFNILKTLPTSWKDLGVADLRVLRNILFPQNVVYTYPKFQTAEIPLVGPNGIRTRVPTLKAWCPRPG
ncbi:MAG: Site-specific recombinase [Candidatus Giovannonibacteria bacterium GW2011_GWB1_46_20]|nr:MAG: Site-specific recombinase [Candidatus Giovannonibacteria bacterium GW2011_GWB1_46_20]